MDHQARRALEMAIADLRHISEKLQAIVPDAEGAVRAELIDVQKQSQAAIRYYTGILSRHPRAKVPPVANRVAQAAFGGSGVGLIVPVFGIPTDPRQQ
ncbi:MAG TPA: hypothetical protein VER03_06935 [Bryobacteraceae bacterium]|nr:hypothetical protein [Bryobacteraceae bacterium]